MLLLTYTPRGQHRLSYPVTARAADPENPRRTFQVHAGYEQECWVCQSFGSVYVGHGPLEYERQGASGYETCPRCGDTLTDAERAPIVAYLQPYVLVAAEALGIHDRVSVTC